MCMIDRVIGMVVAGVSPVAHSDQIRLVQYLLCEDFALPQHHPLVLLLGVSVAVVGVGALQHHTVSLPLPVPWP